MIKFILPIALLSLAACNDGDFINHKLSATKKGTCTSVEREIKMVSNTNGERYQFSHCLPDGFTDKDYQVTRQGDTISVIFPTAQNGNTANFDIVLDVDAKPRYHFIKLGKYLVTVVPSSPY